MKIGEKIITEMRKAEIGKELKSQSLKAKTQNMLQKLISVTNECKKGFTKKQIEMLDKLDDAYVDYFDACEDEAFYYGFKLGLVLGR